MAAEWFWSTGTDRQGPVDQSELVRRISAGDLSPDVIVWTSGMTDWKPARSILPLTAITGGPSTSAQAVSYFTPGGGMPPRAAAILAKHAAPLGDTSDWPLDGAQVAAFASAAKARKSITGASSLFRLLLLLQTIGGVVALIAGVAAMTGNQHRSDMFTLVVGTAVIGMAVLYYFAWKATMRSQRWAPLTMAIIFALLGILELVAPVLASIMNKTSSASAVPGIIGAVLFFIFAGVAGKAYTAIGVYRRHPAWCQELFAQSEK